MEKKKNLKEVLCRLHFQSDMRKYGISKNMLTKILIEDGTKKKEVFSEIHKIASVYDWEKIKNSDDFLNYLKKSGN